MTLSKDKAQELYERMVRIRTFEEKAAALVDQGRLVGEIHVYVGQEASAVGVCAALRDDDYITSTHRGHGHVIAKGADTKRMMAELYGRRTGLCKGKGGSMHVADVRIGILGANGIVGGGLPIATGAGLAAQRAGKGQVAICFFGDGASNEGVFHESINLASVWSLPVVFICENNKYHEFSPSAPLIAGKIYMRAGSYGIPGRIVDGQDVTAVYAAASEAVRRARAGEGPTLIEVDTYRFESHFKGEDKILPPYGDEVEVTEWHERDPIKLFRRQLLDQGTLTKPELAAIDRRMQAEIEEAVAFAEASPLPEPEEALEDLFVNV
ncbi:MAG: thiamine pyrophosphate-dependent dehydrogenase E1 component subunit alpha [Ardenticatenaceae bacterium]|nr:thiamine pyrophosphate-dependent dehydrogenase E1 component subunit alpha [Ardenticatenaceae bacterium]